MASRDEEAEPSHLLRSDALHDYIVATSVLPREPACLRELRQITAQHPWKIMGTTAEGGQFLGLLLKLIGARKTIEVGVFTGYSLLATALAIPDDGQIVALDISRKDYEIGLPVIEKIDFREGPALPALDRLMEDEKEKGSFDFAFVDADKNNYQRYHERLMELVKVGGLIAYDNTLLFGAVAAAAGAALNEYTSYMLPFVVELNAALAADPRVEICQLPVGDGVTLCRRIS